MKMIVYEDAALGRLGPLAQTRPVYELRCGALTLVERQARCVGASSVQTLVRPEVVGLCRHSWPERPVNAPIDGTEVIVVNGRWLAPDHVPGGLNAAEVGTADGEIAWVRLPPGEAYDLTPSTLAWKLGRWQEALPHRHAGGRMIQYPWDLVEHNHAALVDDERHWYTHRDVQLVDRFVVQGPAGRLLIDHTAKVEPMVFFDTTNGPVMIDRGAVVKGFSRLEGPCYVGPHTHIQAGHVVGASIGPKCRIGGEVENSIIQGHSNKAHDGFLGHSYLGEWVNLGAGTQTSDLRNDYSRVKVTVSGQKVETGLLKVGSFIGDHTKASIGTLLNAGSVCGPFAMLVASGGLLPRTIPAYTLVKGGHISERSDLREMFATARTMMGRRQEEWTEAHAEFFLDLYERTAGERFRLARESERRLKQVV